MIYDGDFYGDDKITTYEVAEWIGTCSMLALYWLVCATMYQLSINIQILTEVVDNERGQKKICCMHFFACAMSLVQFVMIGLCKFFH